MRILKEKGVRTTAPAIFTLQQALMAAVTGAEFVAPYVNRLDNVCADGVSVVEEIVQLLERYHLPAKVLAASFRRVEQVHKASLCGGQAFTASPEILNPLLKHPLTDPSVGQFVQDWEKAYREGGVTTDLS